MAAPSISAILDGLADLLSDLCASPAGDQEGFSLFDHHSTRFWRSFGALKQRLEERHLSVAVLALTKSGKSTLLNALIGAHLLPMNNVPETARICKVVHSPDPDAEPTLEEPPSSATTGMGPRSGTATVGAVTARGQDAVRLRLHELNAAVREGGSLGLLTPGSAGSTGLGRLPSLRLPRTGSDGQSSLSCLESGLSTVLQDDFLPARDTRLQVPDMAQAPVASGLGQGHVLSIHTPIAALLEYESMAGNMPSGGIRMQLLDTPGPNEAGEEGLKHQVERVLDSVDAVLYLLDYTKLKTQDEAGLFARLRAVNPALLMRLSQRLFFAVNKMDAVQVSDGQDAEATREYVAQLVTQQMGVPGFRLQPEQVLLLSARNALLSRLVLRGTADVDTRARFNQLAFGRFFNPALVTQDQVEAAAGALLADSGVLELEARVLGFLQHHAGTVKELALVDDLGRLLTEVLNVAASSAAGLSTSADVLAARVAEVRAQLDHTAADFEAANQAADKVGEQVVSEVRAQLQTLRCRLFSAIVHALDTSGAPDGAALPDPVPGAGELAAVAAQDAALSRRWRAVRDRFLSMFTSVRSSAAGPHTESSPDGSRVRYYPPADASDPCSPSSSAAVLSAAGQAVARSRSKADLAALLVSLHQDLTAQIDADVREFWGQVEGLAVARHAQLLAALNEHLARLSHQAGRMQVEGAVAAALDVQLSPVPLRLEPPDALAFHDSLEELLANGVTETRERHIRVNQREVQQQVLRRGGGICRWGEYWESVPRMRTVVEAYTLMSYELVPSRITQHFITMVDQAIDVTQASLAAYVSEFVARQLADARQQLHDYSASYMSAMSASLEAHTRGSEHRLAALAQVKSFLARAHDLAAQRDQLQASLEALAPRAGPGSCDGDIPDLSDAEDAEERAACEQRAASELLAPEGAALLGDPDVIETDTRLVAHALGSPAGSPGSSMCASAAGLPPTSPRAAATQPHMEPSVPVPDAAPVDSESSAQAFALDGSAAPYLEDEASTSNAVAEPDAKVAVAVQLPAQPFDYASGFVSAMSSSKLGDTAGTQGHQETGSQASSDEWDLVTDCEAN